MFQINQIDVKNEDIAKVETLFGFTFTDEQKAIIRNWSSSDIQACPGSGKTTTLAAKLIILAEKLPKAFQQGICVITHTNIAVKEIKNKLGDYSKFYEKYPHHFGTIQSFVDKYLAIPAYKHHFKQAPKIIDHFHWLEVVSRDTRYANFSRNKFIMRSQIDVSKLVYNRHDFKISKKIDNANPFVREQTDTYKNIKRWKDEFFKEGYISYAEAYSIAFSYLRQYPQLKNLFSKRFPIVFIDEMQDMETHQHEIIKDLFDDTNVVVQRIGDTNQSIFNSISSTSETWAPQATLHLTKTNRLPKHIANIVQPICLNPQPMTGREIETTVIQPTIIIFNNETINLVKNKFIELIKEHNLHLNSNNVFKAVGMVKEHNSLGIKSYWEDFDKKISPKNRQEFTTLKGYIDKCSLGNKNVKSLRKTILHCISYALKIERIKHPVTEKYFTSYTLIKFLKENHSEKLNELNISMSKWILKLNTPLETKEDIKSYIVQLVSFFSGRQYVGSSLKTFLNSNTSDLQNENEPVQEYTYENISIYFDTVHGIKGETHTATLYLETFNRTFDIGAKILPYIVNRRADNACKKKLPFAYVVMSRPTDLLCLAVHESRFTKNLRAYFENINNGWSITRC